MTHLATAIFLAILSTTFASHYKDCGSKDGIVTGVSVKGCSDSDSLCTLIKGSGAEITINFRSNVDSNSVKAVVHGIVFHVPMPFTLQNSNGCSSGISCPIRSGNSYTYQNSVKVLKSYPSVMVDIKYELKDQNGNDLVCVLIPSKIK
nr:NPC intracellular cholesterol transporter 2-like isoform X2 [Parasteatoda tepidariorum]